MSKNKFRIEHDALGEIKVPADAIYGSFTVRANQNFNLSGQKTPRVFLKSLGILKQAAARANSNLKQLDPKAAEVIEKAAIEYAEFKFKDAQLLDPFQAGAGTPLNMNANEIIANRANQILKKPLGKYDPVHPNDHVNMAQSTNDVVPTATRLAALLETEIMEKALEKLIASFDKHVKDKKNQNQIKVGRTHLEDAVPMTVSQEFSAWRDMLAKDLKNIREVKKNLFELGIGGNAIGSGINSHPKFKSEIIKELKKITGFNFTAAKNTFEINQSMTPFLNFSAGLRALACDLIKLANDLKLLNMGPRAGIGEYRLPEVEPGSSIMPGKVNPSIAEAVEMTCFQVLGNDQVVSMAAQRGQLQLNIFAPVIMFNLLWSLDLLANTLVMLKEHCIDDMRIDYARCRALFDASSPIATAMVPYLGYHKTAILVKEALKKGKTIPELIKEKKLLNLEDLEKILQIKNLTQPGEPINLKKLI